MNESTIISKIKENTHLLNECHVKKIGIFGSYIHGTETKESDIDLLVEFDESAFGENYKGYFDSITSLTIELENLLENKVDLLTPDMISPYIASDILKEVKYIEGL